MSSALRAGLRERNLIGLIPSPEFLLFFLHPIASMLNTSLDAMRDPGVGWRLVTGNRILATGEIPVADAYSFTATGTEVVSFYWLFEACSAILERIGGLALFSAVSILVYAVIPVLLYRRMTRMGVGTFLALFFAVIAYGVLQMHAHARPHIVTYVFFALLLDRVDRFQTGVAPPLSLWWLPLLALLWCNMHGGFVVGLALVALYTAVSGVRFALTRHVEEKRRCAVYAALFVAMSLATLVNPAGPWLHLSIFNYFGMQSIDLFSEWKSPSFTGDPRTLALELLILSFPVFLAMRARLDWIEAVLIVFFLHQSLLSVRHINLFVIVAAPIVARELLRAMDRYCPKVARDLARVRGRHKRRSIEFLYYGAFCAGFLVLATVGALPLRDNLDDVHLSSGAAAYIEKNLERFKRPFNTDNLGGALIYRFWPDLQVFVDDRIRVYGDEFISSQYMTAVRADPGWDEILDRWNINAAVVKSGTPLAAVLAESQRWNTAHRDGLTSVFLRGSDTEPPTASKAASPGGDVPGSQAAGSSGRIQ